MLTARILCGTPWFRRFLTLTFLPAVLLWPCGFAAALWASPVVTIPEPVVGASEPVAYATEEDQPLAVPFSVVFGSTPPLLPLVSARAVSTNLASVAKVEFDGTNGVVRLLPKPDAFGFGTLWVIAQELDAFTGATLVASNRVSVRWTSVNDAPELFPIPNQRLEAGMPPLAVPLFARDVESPTKLTFTVEAQRLDLLSELAVTNVNGVTYLKLATTNLKGGNMEVIVTVSDPQGASAHVSLTVDVPPAAWARISTRVPNTPTNLFASLVDLDADGDTDLTGKPPLVGPRGNFRNVREVWADLDGDGRLDLLRTSSESVPGQLAFGELFRQLPSIPGSESIGFTIMTNSVPLHRTGGLAWEDLDGDGGRDVIGGPGSRGLVGSLRLKNGSYIAITNNLPPATGTVIPGDFDGDGLPDLLLSDSNAQGVQRGFHALWHNEGGFRFSPSFEGIWLSHPTNSGTVDFDGDGRLDVWVVETAATPQESNQLLLWRNTEFGFELTARFSSEVPRIPVTPIWGDFDGDGNLDFIFPRLSAELYFANQVQVGRFAHYAVFENDGEGNFRPGRMLGPYFPTGLPAVGDYDGDGSLDIWLPGPEEQILQQVRTINRLPGTPTGLQAFVTGTNVLFVWNQTTDPNQTAALTYNLRVGTQPGTNDVIASASLADGTRQIPAPGNNGFSTHRLLVLPQREFAEPKPRKLYWSVQAVDNSWAGGPWAEEKSLAVDLPRNESPQVFGLPGLLILRSESRRLQFTVRDGLSPWTSLSYRLLVDNPALVIPQETAKPFGLPSVEPLASITVQLPQLIVLGETTVSLLVTDFGGLTSTNRFQVSVQPPAPLFELSATAGSTGPRIFLRGPVGRTFRIEASGDLMEWSQVTRMTLNPNPIQELFLDSIPGAIGVSRYFRATPE